MQGSLYTDDGLDRETKPSYYVTLEARDNNLAPPSQQQKTPGYMNIFLIDVNDNPPVFEHDEYHAESQESSKVNSVIVTVTATDADEADNGLVLYAVNSAASNSSDLFDVNPQTGQIFTNKALQGHIGHFLVVVLAEDQGHPQLSSSTKVYIVIEDVNDNAPEIVEPDKNETIYIVEVGHFSQPSCEWGAQK